MGNITCFSRLVIRRVFHRIGVAVSDVPEGPFKPESKPIEGSYSVDPASFFDDDGEVYLYFVGFWGGQRKSLSAN